MSHEDEFADYKNGALPKLNEISVKFLQDLEEERQRLAEEEFPVCAMLINFGMAVN